jgi:hypothetical protein
LGLANGLFWPGCIASFVVNNQFVEAGNLIGFGTIEGVQFAVNA